MCLCLRLSHNRWRSLTLLDRCQKSADRRGRGGPWPQWSHVGPRGLEYQANISIFAGRNGLCPNLLYYRRSFILEGGSVAVTGNDNVTSDKVVRQFEDRIREPKRHPGRK